MNLPLVEINLVEKELTQDQKVKMANDICDLLMKAIPNLPKNAITVIFCENPAENWVVGGVTVKGIIEKAKK